jgi:hypothetical protein
MTNFVELIKTLSDMKRINTFLVFLLIIWGAQAQDSQPKVSALASFGEKIEASGAMNVEDMTDKYEMLAVNDTLQTKFKATVTDVCQSKGCWMKLQLEDGSKTMVRFKDYGFFMPKDIAGKQVIVNGKAFVEEMSIADQQHYAEDAGKSAEEIAKIISVKKTFGFEADGVLLEE